MGSEATEASEPFYATIPTELSQGDIIKGVPWGVIEHPLTICRQGGNPPSGDTPGKAFYNNIEHISKLWDGREIESLHASARAPVFSVAIWDSCQIDKFKNQGAKPHKAYLAVAPVLPLSAIPEKDRQAVIDGRRMAFFPVPAFPLYGIEESYVDLRLIWPVKQQVISDRVVAFGAEARSALLSHLFTFLTARRLVVPETCSSCGAAFDPSTFFEDCHD